MAITPRLALKSRKNKELGKARSEDLKRKVRKVGTLRPLVMLAYMKHDTLRMVTREHN